MTLWNPVWKITIDGVEYQNITLANMSISSGRTDYYTQPQAGYCNLEIIQLNNQSLPITINSAVTVSVKKSDGSYVAIFGGNVSDYVESVKNAGEKGVTTSVQITAIGALARLQTNSTYGVLSKDFDGNQIKTVLQDVVSATWSSVSASQNWAIYPATTTWAQVYGGQVGTIDTGLYELQSRTSSLTDAYSLISSLATSGMGYVYEDAGGLINYADATHRSAYLASNGYVNLTGHHALWQGIRTSLRAGNIRNKIALLWRSGTKNNQDATSITSYGIREATINTTLHNDADATAQAAKYLQLRAYPQPIFDQITFPLTSSEIDDADRDAMINIFMGMPVEINDLPANISNGQFQGFVEGWTWRVGYNSVFLTFNTSPTAFSTSALRWSQVSASEAWNTLSGTLRWYEALETVA
jgi:hypothetical protein